MRAISVELLIGRIKTLFPKPTPEAEFRPDQMPRPYDGPPSAGAFLLPGRFVFVTYGRVPASFSIQCEPTVTLTLTATDEELGRAAMEVLGAFRPSHVVPDDFSEQRKRQLRKMGVPSERQLQMQALYCGFSRGLDAFEFLPTHNGGTAGNRSGFQFNKTDFTTPHSSSVEEIGAAVRKAFSFCTSIYQ